MAHLQDFPSAGHQSRYLSSLAIYSGLGSLWWLDGKHSSPTWYANGTTAGTGKIPRTKKDIGWASKSRSCLSKWPNPNNTGYHISLYAPSQLLRSAEEALLSVSLPAQAQLMGTQERDFSVAAPRLWNSLPQKIMMASSLSSFRKRPISSGRLLTIITESLNPILANNFNLFNVFIF